tara:strand:- start:9204 stop:10280 length:1077 start_codon:yes stop_codon:yes gene_type:complete
MRKIFIALFGFVLVSGQSLASPLITLSGAAASGFSGYKQEAGQSFRGQFENAANVLVDVELSDQVSTQIDMGFGYQNQSGFTNGADISRIAISIAPKNLDNTTLTLGSVTVPFGQFSDAQTDNAMLGQYFIFNDLGYSFLNQGNSLNNFSSVGALGSTDFDHYGMLDVLFFNGTDDTATNTDKGFGVALRYTNDTLIDDVTLGVSAMNVNDSGNANAINANTTGFMGDVKTSLYDIELGGYVAMFTLDDGNVSTKDDVNTFMAYASKKLDQITVSGRYSMVMPSVYNGDGVGGTTAMPMVGLGNVPFSDVDTTRIQLSAIYHLEENVNINNEIIFDTYGENRTNYNNTAFLSYASVAF